MMPVTMFYLPYSTMCRIKETCPKLRLNIEEVEVKLINKKYALSLDYIISRNIAMRRIQRTQEEQDYRNMLTVKMKNCIMQQIIETRKAEKKPDFREVLTMAITKQRDEMMQARR